MNWLGCCRESSEYDDRSDEFFAIRYLVRAWREAHFVAYAPPGGTPRCTMRCSRPVETENEFLARLDLSYRIRRLEFVLTKIDQLSCLDHSTEELFTQRGARTTGRRSEGDREAFRAELERLRGELRAVYEPLRRGRDALQRGAVTESDRRQVCRISHVGQTDLHRAAQASDDRSGSKAARTMLSDEGRAGALGARGRPSPASLPP